MAVHNSVVTITTGAGQVLFDPKTSGSSAVPCKVLLTPDTANTGKVYLGESTVTADATATGGTPIPSTGIAVDIMPNEVLYASADAVGQKVRILVLGA